MYNDRALLVNMQKLCMRHCSVVPTCVMHPGRDCGGSAQCSIIRHQYHSAGWVLEQCKGLQPALPKLHCSGATLIIALDVCCMECCQHCQATVLPGMAAGQACMATCLLVADNACASDVRPRSYYDVQQDWLHVICICSFSTLHRTLSMHECRH